MCSKKSMFILLLLLFFSSSVFASLSAEDQKDMTSLKILSYRQQKLIRDLEEQYNKVRSELQRLKDNINLTSQEREQAYYRRLKQLTELEADLTAARELSESLQNQLDKALASSKKLKNGTLLNNLKWVAAGIGIEYLRQKLF